MKMQVTKVTRTELIEHVVQLKRIDLDQERADLEQELADHEELLASLTNKELVKRAEDYMGETFEIDEA